MPILDELAAYLVNASTRYAVGPSSTAISIWKSQMPPDEPNTAIGMYEAGGPGGEYTQTGFSFERPSIQVICRSTSYVTARDNAALVHSILSAVENLDISKSTSTGVTRYVTVSPVQSPFDMGRDAEDRALISCNYVCEKELS